MEKICFEILGLKEGNVITFSENNARFRILGHCNPEGGQFVRNDTKIGEGWHTIRLATRMMIGNDRLEKCDDIWKLWEHKGEILREKYERIISN